jgi:hypothetical protein
MRISMHTATEVLVGRANVYLPDDLERRVKAARIPISEVCQRALLAAVQAAESGSRHFDDAVRDQLRRGREAGESWAARVPPEQLFTLVRDMSFDRIPDDALPTDLYSLTGEQSLAWEAGFSAAAREAASAAVSADSVATGAERPTSSPEPPAPVRLAKTVQRSEAGSELGDDSGCRIGSTIDETPVCFDPHAAVRTGKSPLFAVLGQGDLRARLSLSVAQDAASRGAAVVLVDLSGQISARARGLGKNVRVVRSAPPSMPTLDDLASGAVGLGGLWELLSGWSAGGGLGGLFGAEGHQLPTPGHVIVVEVAGDGGLANALSLAQAANLLRQFATPADHPRLVQIDLPSTIAVPTPVAAQLNRIIRAARERNTALGLSADGVRVVTDLTGNGSLLSTVFAFATSNPVEADQLRELLGPAAPILINPPGANMAAEEQTWVAMRDLHGRLGQVRLDAW